jgi:O-antigen ligase
LRSDLTTLTREAIPGKIHRCAGGSPYGSFGQPITNIRYRSGRRPASQPHNVHMTIAARMGLAGVLLWILFNAAVVARLGQAFRREADPVRFPGSWFLLVYFAGLLLATVQQWLENPSGTIPFFLLVGYGVGMAIASRPEPAPPPVASSVPPEA